MTACARRGDVVELTRQRRFFDSFMVVCQRLVIAGSAKSALLNTLMRGTDAVISSNKGFLLALGARESSNSMTRSIVGIILLNSFRALFICPGYQLIAIVVSSVGDAMLAGIGFNTTTALPIRLFYTLGTQAIHRNAVT